MCKKWGYSDEQSLERCRKSEQHAEEVVSPKVAQAMLRAINSFKKQLGEIRAHKTIAESADYRPASINDIARATGGAFPSISADANFPLKGQHFKIIGRIVTNIPSPEDKDSGSSDEPQWKPRTYQLVGEMPKEQKAEIPIINLDIESLNRDERQFIQDHCEMLSFTACNAEIFGRVDHTSQKDGTDLDYRGIVVEQADIQPIDMKTYKLPAGAYFLVRAKHPN